MAEDEIVLLYGDLVALCQRKNMSNQDIHCLIAMVATKGVVKRFGEEGAIRIAIKMLNEYNDVNEMFYAIERTFGFIK